MGPGLAALAAVTWTGLLCAAQGWPPLPPARPAIDSVVPRGRSADPSHPAPSEAPLPPDRPPEFGPGSPPMASPSAAPVRPAQTSTAPSGPPPSGAPQAPSPVPAWPRTGHTIGDDAPVDLVPGAFPVDQMDAACTRVLAGGKVAGRREAGILGPNGCGIAYPMTLQAVVLPDGTQVAFQPAPMLRCDLAEVLADWVREDLASVARDRGRLTAVIDAAAYVCRGRNNVFGAMLSEHGRGDAIDILGLKFTGASVMLTQTDAHDVWGAVKERVCNRFMTVLGPGSDGYHENNLHLDLEVRHNGSHYCHWDKP